MSPGSYRGSFDSTTSPTACAVITSPTSRPFAYERAVLMRLRWYGSTESQCVRTSTSPGPGDGTSASSRAKSDSSGKPTGRDAIVTRRFTRTANPRPTRMP